VTLAARQLFGNTPAHAQVADYWSLRHPVPYTLLWVVLLLLIFIPLSVLQYKKAASR
jgi:ABC-2 type transport system permease protein